MVIKDQQAQKRLFKFMKEQRSKTQELKDKNTVKKEKVKQMYREWKDNTLDNLEQIRLKQEKVESNIKNIV